MSKTHLSAAAASSALRALRVLKALKGHSLTGLSNGEIAAATGESPCFGGADG